jgi:hypothetical protein
MLLPSYFKKVRFVRVKCYFSYLQCFCSRVDLRYIASIAIGRLS